MLALHLQPRLTITKLFCNFHFTTIMRQCLITCARFFSGLRWFFFMFCFLLLLERFLLFSSVKLNTTFLNVVHNDTVAWPGKRASRKGVGYCSGHARKAYEERTGGRSPRRLENGKVALVSAWKTSSYSDLNPVTVEPRPLTDRIKIPRLLREKLLSKSWKVSPSFQGRSR